MPKTAFPKKSRSPAPAAVHYRVLLSRPKAHLLTIECTVPHPAPTGETFALPAWIPGSYLIRDFARHVVSFTADADEQPALVKKLAVDRWQVTPPEALAGKAKKLTVRIEVYAGDLSVRGAHLDSSHAFLNGSSIFLRVVGRESHACQVRFERPDGDDTLDWRIATSLPRAGATELHSFGNYQAAHYAELIDHPIEMGRFDLVEFDIRGVRHEMALTGRHRADLDRLRRDLKKICAWQLDFWGKPYPTARYVFLTTCVGEGYGGLEHRASTALICARSDLPQIGETTVSEAYRKFLGLVSHEYFHTWLVKRIQPAEFAIPGGPDLQVQNPTELLWLFEGFTSYYDDLVLLRSGVISLTDYLSGLAKTILNVHTGPGRFQQSLADASFDAWIKFYKPDENSANVTVSYYAKGALFALALDLSLREVTQGKRSLDDVMRRLWAEHGQTGAGVTEADVRRLTGEMVPGVKGKRLDQFFEQAVHGTGDLPLKDLLATHGIDLRFDGGDKPSLGIKLLPKSLKIATVYNNSAAQAAGLSADDTLVALNGLRLFAGKPDAALTGYGVGDQVSVHAFRGDELHAFTITLQPAIPDQCVLQIRPDAKRSARDLGELWRSGKQTAKRLI